MSEFLRLALLILLAGAAVTFLGSLFIWVMEEERRIRRSLRHVLGAAPEAMIVAPGRGRGAGFAFSRGALAVTWDTGAWCLVYRIDELAGAELIVDGQVLARSFSGEARRALDQIPPAQERVTLRLVFHDPQHPDFPLDLWLADAPARRGALTAPQAVQEANRWISRTEAILRRGAVRRPDVAVREPQRTTAPEPVPAAPPPPPPEPVPTAPPPGPVATAPLQAPLPLDEGPELPPWDEPDETPVRR